MELQYYLLDRIYFNWYLALDLPEYPDLLPFVFAYDDQGRRIYLQRSLGIQPDQRIYRRVLYNQLGEPVRDVVVKWVSEDLGDFGEEPTKWLQVESRGVDLPWFATQFQFWGEPAFVTELLEPITTADDPLAIGRTVLETIRRIHGLGVHNDIKPDNILARTEPDGRRSYFLIDWARMTTEPKLYGFERFTFSPPWTSQVKETGIVTTSFNDLKELTYTMNRLFKRQRPRFELYSDPGDVNRDVKNPPILFDFMERIRRIDERNITEQDFDDLQVILNRPNPTIPRYRGDV